MFKFCSVVLDILSTKTLINVVELALKNSYPEFNKKLKHILQPLELILHQINLYF